MNRETHYNTLRKKNIRLSKNRLTIIEILENQHLTFQELRKELFERGLPNVSSIYNNLVFLVNEKIVAEIFIKEKKHYELVLENSVHDASNHVHFLENDSKEIVEIDSPNIIDYIKKDPNLANFKIDEIMVIIKGKVKGA